MNIPLKETPQAMFYRKNPHKLEYTHFSRPGKVLGPDCQDFDAFLAVITDIHLENIANRVYEDAVMLSDVSAQLITTTEPVTRTNIVLKIKDDIINPGLPPGALEIVDTRESYNEYTLYMDTNKRLRKKKKVGFQLGDEANEPAPIDPNDISTEVVYVNSRPRMPKTPANPLAPPPVKPEPIVRGKDDSKDPYQTRWLTFDPTLPRPLSYTKAPVPVTSDAHIYRDTSGQIFPASMDPNIMAPYEAADEGMRCTETHCTILKRFAPDGSGCDAMMIHPVTMDGRYSMSEQVYRTSDTGILSDIFSHLPKPPTRAEMDSINNLTNHPLSKNPRPHVTYAQTLDRIMFEETGRRRTGPDDDPLSELLFRACAIYSPDDSVRAKDLFALDRCTHPGCRAFEFSKSKCVRHHEGGGPPSEPPDDDDL